MSIFRMLMGSNLHNSLNLKTNILYLCLLSKCKKTLAGYCPNIKKNGSVLSLRDENKISLLLFISIDQVYKLSNKYQGP